MIDVEFYLLLLLATFWGWETLRYALEQYLPSLFQSTRALHPLVVAVLPTWVLWPNWVAGIAVAGATGLLVATADRFLSPSTSSTRPTVLPRRRPGGGLPSLP